MKNNKETKLLISRGLFLLVTLVITAGILFYLNNLNEKRIERSKWLKSNISSSKKEISEIDSRSQEFSKSEEIWTSVSNNKKLFKGIRINEAKKTVNDLKDKYKLSTLEFSFSKPRDLTKDSSSDLISDNLLVSESQIDLKVSAITDIKIINFYLDFINSFPGYIKTKSFSLEKTSDIDRLKLIEVSKGSFPSFINSQISLTWRDLKLKEKPNNEKEGENL